jgi:hypothetical protein
VEFDHGVAGVDGVGFVDLDFVVVLGGGARSEGRSEEDEGDQRNTRRQLRLAFRVESNRESAAKC